MRTFTVQLDDAVAEKLSGLAAVRGVNVEYLVAAGAEALADDLQQGDSLTERHQWTAEDLAAINEGLAQLDRGESYSQEEVEAHIDAVLRGLGGYMGADSSGIAHLRSSRRRPGPRSKGSDLCHWRLIIFWH